MTYFRVPASLDNKVVYKDGKHVGFLIGKELYTEREADRLKEGLKYLLEQVEVKRSRTYWMFGARFAMDD